jgi:DNA-binding NtrC family response regulator
VDWYPLIGHNSGKGYQTISMSHENKKVTKSIHRLVCMAFHGMPPTPSRQTRHLDGNPENNVPSNLVWGTQEENWMDRKAHGHGIEGEKHHNAKLKDFERAALKWALAKGLCSQRHAARMLGMSQASIYAVAHSK